jgi:hypothetical protein
VEVPLNPAGQAALASGAAMGAGVGGAMKGDDPELYRRFSFGWQRVFGP